MGPALILLACGGPTPVDTGFDFGVVAATPEDGATTTQAEQPTITFSAPANAKTCTTDTIRLDGLTRDATSGDTTVDFPVEISLSWTTEEVAQLLHAELLPRGWVYGVTVRGGEDGCTSAEGAVMAGFFADFSVP